MIDFPSLLPRPSPTPFQTRRSSVSIGNELGYERKPNDGY